MIPGDEMFGFDRHAFVERLIEETGVAHVWKPVATRIPAGGRTFVTTSVNFTGQTTNPERNAKHQADKYCGRFGRGFPRAWTK
jgi:hypothetical protein